MGRDVTFLKKVVVEYAIISVIIFNINATAPSNCLKFMFSISSLRVFDTSLNKMRNKVRYVVNYNSSAQYIFLCKYLPVIISNYT